MMADTRDQGDHAVDIDADVMLTTIDNPFNPHTQFKQWFVWDEMKGYHTSGLLARETYSSYELPESMLKRAIEDAIDDIVSVNYSGMHIRSTMFPDGRIELG